MFDTVAIAVCFMTLPDVQILIANGCKAFLNRNGEVYKVVLNGKPDAKEPRITITKSFKGFWRMQIEVSIGAWLFNSNIFLPTEQDLERFFSDLSLFILYKIGIEFDFKLERTTILDITRDFYLTEGKVMSVIKELSSFDIPKYNRRPFNDTSVYWENKGKKKNKVYKIYSKYHDFINKGASEEEIELAKGILRLEIHHGDNRAVSDLGKMLKLPFHNAGQIITAETSEKIICNTIKLFNLDSVIDRKEDSKLEALATDYDSSMPLILAGHLLFKQHYGAEYYKVLNLNLKPETVKEYERKCAKTGTLSL